VLEASSNFISWRRHGRVSFSFNSKITTVTFLTCCSPVLFLCCCPSSTARWPACRGTKRFRWHFSSP
jgi:hypothetical protein